MPEAAGLARDTGCAPPTDWVEHALETEGVPYLHTPDEEMSWLVAHSADVVVFTLGMLLAAGAVLLCCVQAALQGLRTMPDKVKQV